MYVLALVVCSASALFAQRTLSADEIAQAGTFDGQLYANKALGLTILAPGGWSFYAYTQNQALVATNRKGKLNPSSANTQVLFQATPPPALGGDKSALFSAGIEKLARPQRADNYAKENRDTLVSMAGITLSRDIYPATFGDVTFSAFEVSGRSKGVPYQQVYLATVRRGVAIFFVETFYDNKNTFATEASLKTLKFGK
jgi:hypothetical protein